MLAESTKQEAPAESLRHLLITYLRASKFVGWPGTDGLTEDDIVNCYPQAISAGNVPGWHELQIRFPGLASELQALRSAKGWIESATGSARMSSPHGFELARINEPRREAEDIDHVRLSRWLVSFASESGWYPVGEFIALDATAAIEQAIEVFGAGAAHQAEEIPWDAAPLFKVNPVGTPKN
jgi:hypothetical protein